MTRLDDELAELERTDPRVAAAAHRYDKAVARILATPCPCKTAPCREDAMVVICRDDTDTPTVWCDPCIAPLVAALNDGGVPTVASCCGHGDQPGVISLADGRNLWIGDDTRTPDGALIPWAPSGVSEPKPGAEEGQR